MLLFHILYFSICALNIQTTNGESGGTRTITDFGWSPQKNAATIPRVKNFVDHDEQQKFPGLKWFSDENYRNSQSTDEWAAKQQFVVQRRPPKVATNFAAAHNGNNKNAEGKRGMSMPSANKVNTQKVEIDKKNADDENDDNKMPTNEKNAVDDKHENSSSNKEAKTSADVVENANAILRSENSVQQQQQQENTLMTALHEENVAANGIDDDLRRENVIEEEAKEDDDGEEEEEDRKNKREIQEESLVTTTTAMNLLTPEKDKPNSSNEFFGKIFENQKNHVQKREKSVDEEFFAEHCTDEAFEKILMPNGAANSNGNALLDTWNESAIRLGIRLYLCEKLPFQDDPQQYIPVSPSIAGRQIEQWQRIFHRRQRIGAKSAANNFIWLKHFAFRHGIEFRVCMPSAFDKLRWLFNIQLAEFLRSMTDGALEEMKNPAAGGSKFFFTSDRKYLLKSVQKTEQNFFFKEDALPFSWEEKIASNGFNGGFADYLTEMEQIYGTANNNNNNIDGIADERSQQQQPKSLLPKFLLLFEIKNYSSDWPAAGELFLVSDSLFTKSHPKIDWKFDLKGAVLKRHATQQELQKAHPTLLDLDFARFGCISHWEVDKWVELLRQGECEVCANGGLLPAGIQLAKSVREQLLANLQRDTKFLMRHHIMDYSLLLGIHFVDTATTTTDFERKNCNFLHAIGNFKEMQIFLGIIDMLQPYTPNRELERIGLKMYTKMIGIIGELAMPETVYDDKDYALNCITEPVEYRDRFMDYIQMVVFPDSQPDNQMNEFRKASRK